MEDLLTYSKYERFDEEERLVIQKSSSRALEEEPLAVIPGDDDALQCKSLQSLLKEYLDACSKEQHQQTDEERHSVLMVQQYAGQLRRDMMHIETAMLDECQFLFCLPLGWACDPHMQGLLRALLIQTGWMTQDDPKNRLIFSPFVESLIAYETIDLLARENKYLLLSMDNTAIHLSSFQMQSAKELIAVSRKLAASDFLLVPTDLGNAVTMDISDLDRLVYDSVKETVVRRILNLIQRKRYYKKGSFKFQNGNKKTTQKQHNNINAATQPLFSTTSLHRTLKSIVNSLYEVFFEDKDKGLHTVLFRLKESKTNLQGMTCGAFMDELLAHAKVKGFVDRVVCTVKEQYSRYSNLQNSPDGIQGIVLHCRSVTNMFHREIIRIALLDANLIDAQNEFIHERNICFGAMQKPFKMVQIANALLPPMVWNQRNNSNQAEPMDYTSSQQDDLLPPNSFYVQAYINDDCIRFILNKVVAVSCLNGAIQKSTFTINEMSVKLECIFDSVCNNMWNHLVAKLEYQGEPKVHDHCDTHLTGDYSAVNYHVFQRSIHEMTENLLQGKGAKCTLDIDVHHTIAISDECNCSFQISYRALIDKGLQPVIRHMATIVASSLASNSFFGLYTVSALIIMDEFQKLMIHDHDNTFKKAMERCLEAHHRRPIVFYDRDAVMVCESLGNWCTGVQQIFGHGSYSQVSSTDYLLRFRSARTVGVDENFGMYKYHSNAFIQGDSIERPNDFAILKKGHALDPSGSTVYAFYQKDCSLYFMNLDLCVLKRHKDKVYAHSIGRCIFRYVDMSHPFTIRVTPRHHESTIEFEVSHVKDYGGTYPVFESFSIQERLALK